MEEPSKSKHGQNTPAHTSRHEDSVSIGSSSISSRSSSSSSSNGGGGGSSSRSSYQDGRPNSTNRVPFLGILL